MRKQKQSSSLGFIAALLVLVLVAFIGYRHFGSAALNERDQIEHAVDDAKHNQPLAPAQQDLLRVQLALVDFMAKKGSPPAALSELIPLYFDSVPKNPDTKKPFFYKRVGKAYQIHATEEEGQTLVAALSSDKGKTPGDSSSGISDKDFINPNTMQIEEFVYDPTSKRDPFLPFDLSPKLNKNSTLSPLEQYAIGQLRLTAVLSFSPTEMTAIVEDAGGKGYTVREGTKIGDSSGVVVKIEKTRLQVLETHIDLTGATKQKVVEMPLETKDKLKPVTAKGKKK